MALGFTEADLAHLKAALASGATEITIDNRTTKFRTLKELEATIKMIQAELDPESITTNPKVVKATFSRGG